MLRSAIKILALISSGALGLLLPAYTPAQSISNRIVSEHVRMLVPTEREWIGRDVIMDLERCWRYVNSLSGGSLPRKVLVEATWDSSETKLDAEGRIFVGMMTTAADPDLRAYLLRSSVKQIARLGLIGLARPSVSRPENDLLLDGMSEIIEREFFRTTRGLAGAWLHARMLDSISPLSLAALTSDSESAEHNELRAQAPAITFLLTCSDSHGRDRAVKLFESLMRGISLEESISLTMKTTAPALEAEWLKKVRAYTIGESLPASQDEETPKLDRVSCDASTGNGGSVLQLRLFVRRGANVLLPHGLYLYDEASGKVMPGKAPSQRGATYMVIETPLEAGKLTTPFSYRVIAIDERGGVSDWQGSCTPGH